MPSSYLTGEPDTCPGVELGRAMFVDDACQCSFSAYELGESPAERYSEDDSGELNVEDVPDGNVEVEGVAPLEMALLGYGESLYEPASELGGNWYEEREAVLMGA